jgi:hypothetical protein
LSQDGSYFLAILITEVNPAKQVESNHGRPGAEFTVRPPDHRQVTVGYRADRRFNVPVCLITTRGASECR